MNIELSEIMKEQGVMADWSYKVKNKLVLSEEEKAISQVVDEWAKEIAESGVANKELSQYLIKVIEPEVYNAPSELLGFLFEEAEIGEFDVVDSYSSPVNRLMANETAPRTGNSDKSYIDFTRATTESVHLQIDTEIRYSDLRVNGYKTIALLTQFAIEALNNKKFYHVFNMLDNLITVPSANGFPAVGGLTVQGMDEFAGYLEDSGTNPLIVGLTTDLRNIKNMDGYHNFFSNEMKNAYNAGSILESYGGVTIAKVPATQKLADGKQLLTPKKIFGIADKVGQMYMRGALRVYQTPDNKNEKIELKFTGFEFVYAINKPEKIAKIVIS